jgi:hypothetical protein
MSRQMIAKKDGLVSVPEVAITKGWPYARVYDAVIRRQFGIPVRIDRRLYVPEEAVESTE